MATVYTQHGPGEIVASETTRGRTHYKVAGKGFEVWLDETEIDRRTGSKGFDFEPSRHTWDNETTLPYNPHDGQFPSSMFEHEQTQSPDHELDAEKRLRPTKSVSGEPGEARPKKGPAAHLFAARELRPVHGYPSAGGMEADWEDAYPDPEHELHHGPHGDDDVEAHYAVRTDDMHPDSHAYHEESYRDEPGMGRHYNPDLRSYEPSAHDDAQSDLVAEDDDSGYNWGPEPHHASRPAGLSAKYIPLRRAAHADDLVARFAADPRGTIVRVAAFDLEAGLDPDVGHQFDDMTMAPKDIRTAAWKDVARKAKRLRHEGRVDVQDISHDRIYAKVAGDHGVYDTMIAKGNDYSGGQSISNWRCSCEWGKWAFKRQMTFVGRLCSHGYAAYQEMQSRHIKGDENHPFHQRRRRKRAGKDVDSFKKWIQDENEGHLDMDAADRFVATGGDAQGEDGDSDPLTKDEAQKIFDYVLGNESERPEREFDLDGYTLDNEDAYKTAADALRNQPNRMTPPLVVVPTHEGEDAHYFTDLGDDRKTTGPGQIQASWYLAKATEPSEHHPDFAWHDDDTADFPKDGIVHFSSRWFTADPNGDYSQEIEDNRRKYAPGAQNAAPVSGTPASGSFGTDGINYNQAPANNNIGKGQDAPTQTMQEPGAARPQVDNVTPSPNNPQGVGAGIGGDPRNAEIPVTDGRGPAPAPLADRPSATPAGKALSQPAAPGGPQDVSQLTKPSGTPGAGAGQAGSGSASGGGAGGVKGTMNADGTYTVGAGDTLSGIAKGEGVDLNALEKGNASPMSSGTNIGQNADLIHPGDKLTLPGGGSGALPTGTNGAPAGSVAGGAKAPTSVGDIQNAGNSAAEKAIQGVGTGTGQAPGAVPGTTPPTPGATSGIGPAGTPLKAIPPASTTGLPGGTGMPKGGSAAARWAARYFMADDGLDTTPDDDQRKKMDPAGAPVGAGSDYKSTAPTTNPTAPLPKGDNGVSSSSTTGNGPTGTWVQGPHGPVDTSGQAGKAQENAGQTGGTGGGPASGGGGPLNPKPLGGGSASNVADEIAPIAGGIAQGIGGMVPGLSGIMNEVGPLVSGLGHLFGSTDAERFAARYFQADGSFLNDDDGHGQADKPFAGSGPRPKPFSTSSEDYIDEHEKGNRDETWVTDRDGDITTYTTQRPRQRPRQAAADHWAFEYTAAADESGYFNPAVRPYQEDDSDQYKPDDDSNDDPSLPQVGKGMLDKAESAGKGLWNKVKGVGSDIAEGVGDAAGAVGEALPEIGEAAAAAAPEVLEALPFAALAAANRNGTLAEMGLDGEVRHYGTSQDQSDIVARFQRSAAAADLMSKGGGGSSDGGAYSDDAIAGAAQAFLAKQGMRKTAGRQYSLAEQRALEEESHPGGARNLASLQLSGTHYEQ